MEQMANIDSLIPFRPLPEVCTQNVPPSPEKCDKTGYLIASFCGAMAGLIDVLFVQAPNEGPLMWQQEEPAVDSFGRRWVRCELCNRITLESEFVSYGGKNHVNLGVCRTCAEKMEWTVGKR